MQWANIVIASNEYFREAAAHNERREVKFPMMVLP